MKFVDAIADAVVAHGVALAVNLPDELTIFLSDALQSRGVRIVRPRHEQNGVLIADGYGRAGDGVGLCIVGAGPAIGQCGTALVTAVKHRSNLLVPLGTVAPDARGAVK